MPPAPKRWINPGRKGQRRRIKTAKELEEAELRTYIARRLSDGAAVAVIAKELKTTKREVERRWEDALVQEAKARMTEKQIEEARARLGIPPGGSLVPVSGVVIGPDDEEEEAFERRAFELRKRALPFDVIAKQLGRSEGACRRAVSRRLVSLSQDEVTDTNLARQMMLEQLDGMIAAIILPASGIDKDGNPAPVILEAIDRMIRLLDQKAKLLGLNAAQKVDVTHRLEAWAVESGYDFEELRDIADQVYREYSARSLR